MRPKQKPYKGKKQSWTTWDKGHQIITKYGAFDVVSSSGDITKDMLIIKTTQKAIVTAKQTLPY